MVIIFVFIAALFAALVYLLLKWRREGLKEKNDKKKIKAASLNLFFHIFGIAIAKYFWE